jgi:hypothetical protein
VNLIQNPSSILLLCILCLLLFELVLSLITKLLIFSLSKVKTLKLNLFKKKEVISDDESNDSIVIEDGNYKDE